MPLYAAAQGGLNHLARIVVLDVPAEFLDGAQPTSGASETCALAVWYLPWWTRNLTIGMKAFDLRR
jgi:hypothetical protein